MLHVILAEQKQSFSILFFFYPPPHLVLSQTALDTPVEVLPSTLPLNNVPHHPLRLHPSGTVVKVRELVRNLRGRKEG